MSANDPKDEQVIGDFFALYSGGLAQKRRDAGDGTAMPPWSEVYWLGKQVVKCPMDLWVYQEIICETRPEVIIEAGTSGGGSAYFFATIFDMLGVDGDIVTVDIHEYPSLFRQHPRITYLTGDSTSEVIANQMRSAAAGKRTMVSLDSLHTYEHVAKELALYGPLVTQGCYLVVEDTGYGDGLGGEWCNRSIYEYVAANPQFTVDTVRERHLLTSNHRGWVRRKY